jgi:hypothetical protein
MKRTLIIAVVLVIIAITTFILLNQPQQIVVQEEIEEIVQEEVVDVFALLAQNPKEVPLEACQDSTNPAICYTLKAVHDLQVSHCDNTQSRELCVTQVAIKLQQESVCESDTCVTRVREHRAFLTGNPEACESQECKEYFAILRRNSEACETQLCRAVVLNNEFMCVEIESVQRRRDCLHVFGVVHQRTDLCNQLPAEGRVSSRQCALDMAAYANNPTVCRGDITRFIVDCRERVYPNNQMHVAQKRILSQPPHETVILSLLR